MKSLCLACFVVIGMVAGLAAVPGKQIELQPELPKTGVNLARDDGGWSNVVVDDHGFVVSFFDDRKMQVAADVHHGLARFFYAAKSRDRTVLTRSADGRTLVSPGNVKGPWVFRVHLALFDEGPDDLVETYAFSYGQD